MLKNILSLEGTKVLNKKELTTLKGGTLYHDSQICLDPKSQDTSHCKQDDTENDIE